MAVKNSAEKVFDAMGVEMTISSLHYTKYFKGTLQPLRYKNKIYLNGVPTELGYDSLKKYLLICSASVELENIDGKDTVLVFEKARYSVDHCEKVYFKNEPFYYWAIIHKEESI